MTSNKATDESRQLERALRNCLNAAQKLRWSAVMCEVGREFLAELRAANGNPEDDPWLEFIEMFVESRDCFTMRQVVEAVLGIPPGRQIGWHSQRVARILFDAGFEMARASDVRRTRYWRRIGCVVSAEALNRLCARPPEP